MRKWATSQNLKKQRLIIHLTMSGVTSLEMTRAEITSPDVRTLTTKEPQHTRMQPHKTTLNFKKKGIACHDNWIQLLLLLLIQGLHCLRCIKQFWSLSTSAYSTVWKCFRLPFLFFYAFAQIVFIKWEVVFVQIVVIVAIDLKVERRRI